MRNKLASSRRASRLDFPSQRRRTTVRASSKSNVFILIPSPQSLIEKRKKTLLDRDMIAKTKNF